MATTHLWWQQGIVYQVYPRSFQDSNGDGIGDLPGIRRRLDYLQSLGVDAIWLSPIYPSPMADFGYDISDYTGIHPDFGTMADFDALLAETHRRGLKLILDLVPNHTSDRHPWFLESRSSRDNPKRDWYIWRDPAPGGGLPNNWLSGFGGPAWTYDPATGQYYLHQYLKEQPDLNFRHPAVLSAILEVMRFWLDRGVDGFRVDVMQRLAKDELFRDEPVLPGETPQQEALRRHLRVYSRDLPPTHQYVRAMRRVMDSYADRVMIGEMYLPNEQLVTYYGPNLDECHLPFNFQLITTSWQAEQVREAVDAYEAALPPGAWPNWVLGNHDRARIASRLGRDQARVAAMLLLTLRGTPTWYYGDEIGMLDVPIPPERVQDPVGINLRDIPGASRDPERTPMQWDAGPNAGFCPPDVEPWLPLAPDYEQINVAAAERDPHSMLALFRRLTILRRASPALSVGDYRPVDVVPAPSGVFVFERYGAGSRFLVALNFGATSREVDLSSSADRGEIVLSTELDRAGSESLASLQLRANEGLILRLA